MAEEKIENSTMLPDEVIMNKIYFIRKQKVMLDKDLAELYGIDTKVLKQQVKRNIERFPDDFMFELTKEEFDNLRSHFVTSSWGGARYMPMVFTEQGVAMLSSVLRSPQAIKVNIQIMRIFTKVREMLTDTLSMKLDIEEIKKKDRFLQTRVIEYQKPQKGSEPFWGYLQPQHSLNLIFGYQPS